MLSIATCSRFTCPKCTQRVVSQSLSTARSSSSLSTKRSKSVKEGRSPTSIATPARPAILLTAPILYSTGTKIFTRPSSSSSRNPLKVLGERYEVDDYTNLSSSILSRLSPRPVLPYSHSHPLKLLRSQIESHLHGFKAIKAPSPIVSTEFNFGKLGFPEDHPGRSPTDTYYLNRSTCLRTHTSAHEVEVFEKDHDRWLLTADVYRRDEIDATHYPIFHQMEGACVFGLDAYEKGKQVERECQEMETELAKASIEIEDNVDLQEAGGWQPQHEGDPQRFHAAQLSMRHLKATLNGLVLELFGERHAEEVRATASRAGEVVETTSQQEPLKVRWISASFPFTSPSFEVEVLFRGKWLEILGCGVVMEKTLEEAGVPQKLGWAFGLGLERIAMVLYSIPDIRLFWSKDPRFLSQFHSKDLQKPLPRSSSGRGEANHTFQTGVSPSGGFSKPWTKLVTFKPYSKYPPCYKDVSFWLPSLEEQSSLKAFHENDLMEIIRDEAADLVEDVGLIDHFVHPKTKRSSRCYRINYRSMDRNLGNEEVNRLHEKVSKRLVNELNVEIR